MGVDIQAPSLYQRLGGETGLRQLVDQFYMRMDTMSELAELRAMHSPDLNVVREVLFEFLSGWLGGPDLYQEKHGEPRLRMRHLPFKINSRMRDQWLLGMFQAMSDLQISDDVQTDLQMALWYTAEHLRNTPDTQ